jgi:large subunit ribosomal protein L15
MKLDNLPLTKNRLQKSKRLGCGKGSGHGKTSSRGNKGGNARSGYSTPKNFSGIPWYRKFPKRGFNNNFKQYFNIVNLGVLETLLPADFSAVIDENVLLELGLIKNIALPVKVLGNGEWKRSLSFAVKNITSGAKAKIEAAGGKIIESE